MYKSKAGREWPHNNRSPESPTELASRGGKCLHLSEPPVPHPPRVSDRRKESSLSAPPGSGMRRGYLGKHPDSTKTMPGDKVGVLGTQNLSSLDQFHRQDKHAAKRRWGL